MTIVPFLNKVNVFILNPLILLAFTLSTVYLLYGIVRFLSLEAVDKSRKEAKDAILWGLVGMFIMVSVYGIIHFVLASFGISTSDPSLGNAKQFINL